MNYLILILVAIVSFAIGRRTAKSVHSVGGVFAPRQKEELSDENGMPHMQKKDLLMIKQMQKFHAKWNLIK